MKREEVLAVLKQYETEIQTYGVERLVIFGSVARDEAGPDSDVDILVEFNKPIGLFGLIALRLYLEQLLGTSIDIGTIDCLKEDIQKEVLNESVYVSWGLERKSSRHLVSN